MSILNLSAPPVNPMTEKDAALTARLKRDVAIYRAAQVLADALAWRAGRPPRGLSVMSAADREWHRGTARQLVEIYETAAGIETPLPAAPPDPAVQQIGRSREAQRLIERQRGRDGARERGHELGLWRLAAEEGGVDEAVCRRCGRPAFIDVTAVPALSGPALVEGCLTAAEDRDVRIATQSRPDAFLSEQHDADLDGGDM